MGQQVRSEVPPLGQSKQCIQGRQGCGNGAMRLLQECQSGVAPYRHKRLHRQCLLDHRHALCQVPFGSLQLVPLAQQVAQAEIVVEAAEDGLQHLRSWDRLHHLLIRGGGLPEAALQDVQARLQADARHG